MIRKVVLPILAGVGILFAIFMIWYTTKEKPVPPIPFQPPTPPYASFVAGAGMTEASSENIAIAAPFSALAMEIFVKPGMLTKKGTPLFKIDDRVLQAQYLEAKASKMVALANFDKLMSQPRPEEVPPLVAKVKQAEVNFMDQLTQYHLYESVQDKEAISVNEFNQRRFAAALSGYQLEEAKATLDLKLAGAWIKDLQIAAMQVEQADQVMNIVSTEIERTTIRAPIDGFVMQVKIRPGEMAQPPFSEDPMMLFGSIDPMHIRVDVDEDDAWRIREGSPATAFLRGNSTISVPLQFVRIEPFVVPKTQLTNDSQERVDTRVLQVIFSFQRKDFPIYLGQIMDVFIQAPPNKAHNNERL